MHRRSSTLCASGENSTRTDAYFRLSTIVPCGQRCKELTSFAAYSQLDHRGRGWDWITYLRGKASHSRGSATKGAEGEQRGSRGGAEREALLESDLSESQPRHEGIVHPQWVRGIPSIRPVPSLLSAAYCLPIALLQYHVSMYGVIGRWGRKEPKGPVVNPSPLIYNQQQEAAP